MRRFLLASCMALSAAASSTLAQTHTIDFENDVLYPEPGLNPFPTTVLHELVDGVVTFRSPAIDGSCCYLPQARVGSFGFFGGGPMAGQPQPSGPLNTRRFARVQCFVNPNDPQGREGLLELDFASPVNSVSFTFGTMPNEGNSLASITIQAEAFDSTGTSLGVFPFTTTINIAPIAPATAEGLAQLPAGLTLTRLRLKGSGECGFSGAYQFAVDNITFTEAGEPPCAADFNGTGGLSVQDIFDFLAAYFGGDPDADFNESGVISVQDIFDFLAAYFAGC